MAVFKSQVIYGLSGSSKPAIVGEGDDAKKLVNHEDFTNALGSTEEVIGNLITQDNAEVNRQNNLITGNIPTELDSGTATAADCAEAINQLITILTSLNVTPKQ